MSKERELLKTILAYMAAEYLVMTEFEMITQIEDTIKEIQELLAQPEQTEYIKKKKEQEIYFVKDEFGTLTPTFKNPKETPFWINVLYRGAE
jgi:hypothetical protein